MANGAAIRVDLFGEDAAHEDFGRAVIERCARDVQVTVTVRSVSVKFGVGRVKRELRAYEATMARTGGVPDLLVVLADANDVGAAARRREIEECLVEDVFPRVVIGTPDPHVERWLLADPVSFAERFGVHPETRAARDRDVWKRRLVDALEEAEEIVVQGGAEFAVDIVQVMDLYRAGQSVPTLGSFFDDVRRELRACAVAKRV